MTESVVRTACGGTRVTPVSKRSIRKLKRITGGTPVPPEPGYNLSMPEIRTRRWNDESLPDDGTRILITRFRPRGVSKADETWVEWIPQLAPSADLIKKYHGKTGTTLLWNSYRKLYLEEMNQQTDRIKQLAERVKNGETITLLCSSACERESRCHRSLLRELIEKQT